MIFILLFFSAKPFSTPILVNYKAKLFRYNYNVDNDECNGNGMKTSFQKWLRIIVAWKIDLVYNIKNNRTNKNYKVLFN